MRKIGPVLIIAAATSLAAIVGSGEAMGNETINYTYDARGRLTNVTHTGNANNNVTANYTYDKADNRVTVNVTGAP